jgi:hypothetical protein
MILLSRRKLWRDLDRYCAIDVRNPGSSGGSGTVDTDGVTIQGDGSGGNPIAIKAVQVNPPISGAGTVASPLALTPITFDTFYYRAADNARNGANQISISGFSTHWPLSFSAIGVFIFTTDGSGLYDMGIYSAAGTLLANIGAQHLSNGNDQVFATVQGAQTIQPGRYVFAWTGNAAVATLGYTSSQGTWIVNQNYASSSGGALPSSLTAFTEAYSSALAWQFSLLT